MRRTATTATTAVTVLLGACLALAGCSQSSDNKPSTTPTTVSSPTADPGDAFITAVTNAHLPSYADGLPDPAELEAFPPSWCDALDAGHSVTWILDDNSLYPIGATWGTQKNDAYQLVLLGAEAYCPNRAGQVKDDLRAAGQY